MGHDSTGSTNTAIELVEKWGAHNYHPLPVVVAHAEGSWVTDVDGKRYLDMLAAYSALNFGHRHPRLIAAAHAQLDRVTLTSRAFHNDQLGPFCEALARLCNKQAVIPMNTGAEAVETAIKISRRWAYDVKGVEPDKAKIIVCGDNFHGRTTTIVGFSTDESARRGFGPFAPGFQTVPYGDLDALAAAIDSNTAAFLIEPVQGEAGVVAPPAGFLSAARELCRRNNVLFVADEVQSGLGRTGDLFACSLENVEPDLYILGKALGGGVYPISAVVGDWSTLGVLDPGSHGSTFGGNPLACAVAREVISMLEEGDVLTHGAEMGRYLHRSITDANVASVKEVRGRGLWMGIQLHDNRARKVCESLLAAGVLCKDTHEHTVRIAPPLTISKEDLDWAIERILNSLG